MTKVIQERRRMRPAAAFLLMAWLCSQGQQSPRVDVSGQVPGNASPLHLSSAEDLFLQLGSVGLDASRVYRARDVSLDRAAFHITLDDGVIAFAADVAGRVTGAFFSGEGEILLTPPNQVERASMMLQTGAAILEERFSNAYFRFNDDTFAALRPFLTPTAGAQEFISQWDQTARNLAASDALRVFMTFARFLPLASEAREQPSNQEEPAGDDDRFLHARLQGETKGTFDVYFDSDTPEQVWAAQARTVDGVNYYDVWTSFSFLPKEKGSGPATNVATEEGRATSIDIPNCKVRAEINPPTTIQAEAVLDLQVRQGGQRAVLFELARTLVIKQVEADGKPVEFIHNPSIDGTQLARHGNDLVAVVFARPTRAGQKLKLRFVYGGEVLSEAGPGLLYVGARGTWYPNRGLGMSNFDLEFRYPTGWNLVATGKRVENSLSEGPPAGLGAEKTGEQVSRWISERPIPFAGFNLGKYRRAVAHAGDVTVEAYGTGGVERGFPETQALIAEPVPGIGGSAPPVVIPPAEPSPARNAQMVAATAARAVEFFSHRFGPYPFTELALTQMPGNVSQGWPGLIFLSSFSFLNEEEKSALRMSPLEKTLIGSVVAHETAHQWWGDLVSWSDYRDQWISEGLANYSALMLLEEVDPRGFHALMGKYRDDLLEKNKSGAVLMEDGPATLGQRLSCSQFPYGYMAISYGRGTWLFHMLRTMMRDAEPNRRKRGPAADPENEPFMRALRRMRDRYEGKSMTTREMLQVFQEDLPLSLRYEGRKSLDWFYEGWVNGTAIPRFELRSVKYTDKEAAGTAVSGTILQKDAPKDLVTPVPLYASHDGKLVFLGRVFADGPETPFHVSAPAGTRKILVDPDQTLLARGR
ncbi:MAG TPA: M1 family aminopeptidase [Terriglobales bacterium]|nr:M1 family aminopeptidase [Terriglobales bacterium]